jgi:hypothetical protein
MEGGCGRRAGQSKMTRCGALRLGFCAPQTEPLPRFASRPFLL